MKTTQENTRYFEGIWCPNRRDEVLFDLGGKERRGFVKMVGAGRMLVHTFGKPFIKKDTLGEFTSKSKWIDLADLRNGEATPKKGQ